MIDESLARATDPSLLPRNLTADLAAVVDAGVPDLDNAALRTDALAVWIEMEIGLDDGRRLTRRKPIALAQAAERLATQIDRARGPCEAAIRDMLMAMNRPERERGGTGDDIFLAFKLHRFISGAGHVHVTLRPPGARKVSLEGQQFHPDDERARLYPT